jgi:hypothetical protein
MSVDELVDAVHHDKALAHRYAAQFGVPAEKIAAYCRANLTFTSLNRPGTYMVYFVGAGGRITSARRFLEVGEKVFVTPSGKPLLLACCGNPLTRVFPENDVFAPPTLSVTSMAQPEMLTDTPLLNPVMSPLVAMTPSVPDISSTVVAVAPATSVLSSFQARNLWPLVGLALISHASTSASQQTTPEPSSGMLFLTAGVFCACASLAKWRRRS